jgi:hypothetical protein
MPPLVLLLLRSRLRRGSRLQPAARTRHRGWLRRCATHPVFGVALLLVLAVALITHGEPQPSSRPSGRSVLVGPTSSAPVPLARPATVLIRGEVVERVAGTQVRRITLPAGVAPVSVLTSDHFSVVLGQLDGYQNAYGITSALRVINLGRADGVIASARAGAAVIIEQAVTDAGRLPGLDSTVTQSAPATASAGAGKSAPHTSAVSGSTVPSSSSALPSRSNAVTPAKDYTARRFTALGRPLGAPIRLPAGTQLGTDTGVGLVVWKPVGVVVDRAEVVESLSATATLIRPDGSLRVLGPFHPLAATAHDLLVWDVERGAFGLLSLTSATSTSTATATPARTPDTSSPSAASTTSDAVPAVSRPTPAASPTSVAGDRFFQPTRGFIVTGPASFSPDGSAFAAYAEVGDRRRLVVGQVADVGTDQIEVLALTDTADVPPSASPAPTPTSSQVPVSSHDSTSPLSSAQQSSSQQAGVGVGDFDPDGFPLPAPASPVWFGKLVVGVTADGSLIDYLPDSNTASTLSLAGSAVDSLALAP